MYICAKSLCKQHLVSKYKPLKGVTLLQMATLSSICILFPYDLRYCSMSEILSLTTLGQSAHIQNMEVQLRG